MRYLDQTSDPKGALLSCIAALAKSMRWNLCVRELRAAADRLGHVIVEVYRDHGISGGKGREKRPAFDKLHRDATLRKFDLVMAWSVDRLGRSLQDLVHFLDHLRATRVELFLHQQGLDTTSPAGRAMFGMLSVFSEFERAII
jgi:DNA invertase Pin-like site-specific DNA recombinase